MVLGGLQAARAGLQALAAKTAGAGTAGAGLVEPPRRMPSALLNGVASLVGSIEVAHDGKAITSGVEEPSNIEGGGLSAAVSSSDWRLASAGGVTIDCSRDETWSRCFLLPESKSLGGTAHLVLSTSLALLASWTVGTPKALYATRSSWCSVEFSAFSVTSPKTLRDCPWKRSTATAWSTLPATSASAASACRASKPSAWTSRIAGPSLRSFLDTEWLLIAL